MARGISKLKVLLVVIALTSLASVVGLAFYANYMPDSSSRKGATALASFTAEEVTKMRSSKEEIQKELDAAQRQLDQLARENRLLKGASERFEDEKAVILEQVRESVSGFAEYKEETSIEIARLTKETEKLENERSVLEEKVEGLTSQSMMTNEILGAKIKELNGVINDHRGEVKRLKALMENAEQKSIVIEAAKLHYNLGNFYFRNNEYEYAAAEYRKSLMYQPQDPDTHYNLAVVCDEHLGLRAEAIKHYKTYLAINPDDAQTLDIENRILDLEMRDRGLAGSTLAKK